MHYSRFIVGIDLGTTNCAVSFLDTESSAGIQQFAVPQLVASGELASEALLPSFCYVPGGHELAGEALALPWRGAGVDKAVGVFARDQGARVPGRLIASAKSWLAHGGVDRTARILPWGGDLGDDGLSPVQVSAEFLSHIRAAWDWRFGQVRDRDGNRSPLSEQQVVITVPASFDEVARELTVRAAQLAGLENFTLLEEPLAAFYGWLAGHESDWQDFFHEGERVLVIDIGGGTTDFSLIQVEPGCVLRRTQVGEHLLLGGDNIDMALARQIEKEWGQELPPREWSMLCHQCRVAKEQLLSGVGIEQVQVSVTGAGAGVVAKARTAAVSRERFMTLLLEGFFPVLAADAAPPARPGGMRRMGLPYVADPAITRHLLSFLRSRDSGGGSGVAAECWPDRVLFNGGTLLPEALRERLRAVVGAWSGRAMPVAELASGELNLAVSRGAAYYGSVRRGTGVRVKGGVARSYYLEIASTSGPELVCVMPRNTEEGEVVEIPDLSFKLCTNSPVRFPLFTSATRLQDRPGELLSDRQDISSLPPLHTVIAYGKGTVKAVDTRIAARLNEVGTLDIWCSTEGGQQYPLSFSLRETVPEPSVDGSLEITVTREQLESAGARLHQAFATASGLPGIYGQLEESLGLPRNDWGAHILRYLADEVRALDEVRARTAEHEERWWNLLGFCLRPGFGVAGDEERIRQAWRLWHSGPVAGGKTSVAVQWWIAWRRLAGGLREGQQQQIGNGLSKQLFDRQGGMVLQPKGKGTEEAREMWRCLGALERLPVKLKLSILRQLLCAPAKLPEHLWWVVGRVGARQLFHGPENCVIPASSVAPLLTGLLRWATVKGAGAKSRPVLFAVSNMCRKCGVRGLDIGDDQRQEALRFLEASAAPSEYLEHVAEISVNSDRFSGELIGDRLPLGLNLRLD